MSLLNTFVTSDAVHLFTDGGQYDPATMVLEGISPKVAILPQLNAVLASTGHMFISQMMQHSINGEQFKSYDAMVAEFETFLPKAIAFWAKTSGGPKDWGLFNIVIAGWSDYQNRPTAHAIRGFGNLESAAFKLRELTRFRAPRNLVVDGMPFDPADPVESGLAIVREQRRQKFAVRSVATTKDAAATLAQRLEDQNQIGFQIVHGFCQHTRVDRDGVHTKILERWD